MKKDHGMFEISAGHVMSKTIYLLFVPLANEVKSMSEKILGKTEIVYIKGRFSGYDRSMLFFTSNRLIVAKFSEDWSHYAPGSPVTFWVSRDREKKKKEDLEQSALLPEHVLKKDAENFAILYSDVEKVEVKRPGLVSPGIAKVNVNGKTYQFDVKKNVFDDFMKLTQSVLANKLSR
jgi:hypothetical protein